MLVRFIQDYKQIKKGQILDIEDNVAENLLDDRIVDTPRCYRISNLCVGEIVSVYRKECNGGKCDLEFEHKSWGIFYVQPEDDIVDALNYGYGRFTHISSRKQISTSNNFSVWNGLSFPNGSKVINIKNLMGYSEKFIKELCAKGLSKWDYITEDELIEKEVLINNLKEDVNKL